MTSSETVTGPLHGVRVLEAGQLLAGPFAGTLMGDLGADVIKVEPPGIGDSMRQWGRATAAEGKSLWWPVVGRNKRSVTLDLRQAEGQEIFLKLVEQADIVVENFRVGTFEKWNLGYEQLRGVNPKIIFVRVSGYGQTGPYAKRAGLRLDRRGDGRPALHRRRPRPAALAHRHLDRRLARRDARHHRRARRAAPPRPSPARARSWTPRSTRPCSP